MTLPAERMDFSSCSKLLVCPPQSLKCCFGFTFGFEQEAPEPSLMSAALLTRACLRIYNPFGVISTMQNYWQNFLSPMKYVRGTSCGTNKVRKYVFRYVIRYGKGNKTKGFSLKYKL